ncbi:phosphoglucosamine mutase [Prochlorococcus sp. MIT 1341]|uniref:phosphoglucosamine mutase n=1 Tax=Prochlorococcus sp. MIT 1341 TaxID=3096221 RepID=UPI002A765272|nr:phosphoglucosamine mutase [Prochlorococcus sp. MIT 1341]
MDEADNYPLKPKQGKINISFGTDGIRGPIGTVLTPSLALELGFLTGEVLNGDAPILIGMDSRTSGPMLASALAAGIIASGKDVWEIGLCTTPAIPCLIKKFGLSGGLMISASHNPPGDNGIKIFGCDGNKLDYSSQKIIENGINTEYKNSSGSNYRKSGKTTKRPELVQSYCQTLLNLFEPYRLDGIRIVLDLCWGSATSCALELFQNLGADVTVINGEPNGELINVDCGSTNLAQLRAAVLKENAAMGFAFDGDADRMLALDERGRLIDGDHILYLWGSELKKQRKLPGNKLVATVMSNLAFEQAWKTNGGVLERTPVGDQHVHKAMIQNGAGLGGEQSGHILCTENGLSGDGLFSALKMATLSVKRGLSLADWRDESFKPFPQKLVNIHIQNSCVRKSWNNCEPLNEAISNAEEQMGADGRVLVRASGTEPLLRLMVEASNQDTVDSWTSELADLADQHLNAA